MRCSLGICNHLDEITNLPMLLFSSISLHCSLKKALFFLLAIFWNSAFRWLYLSFILCLPFLFFSQLFVRPPQITILPFSFVFLGDGFDHHLLTMLQTSVHISSDTLSDLIPWIYLSLPLYNHKRFDLGHTWWPSSFPYFLTFKSEWKYFDNKEFMIWATVSSLFFFFHWLYRASPSSAALI